MAREVHHNNVERLFEKLPLVVPKEPAPPGTVNENQRPQPLLYPPPARDVTDLFTIALDDWHSGTPTIKICEDPRPQGGACGALAGQKETWASFSDDDLGEPSGP